MYFGGALALIAAGAVLVFAIQDRLGGVDLVAVGYILMIVGALGIVLSLIVNSQRTRRGDVRRDDPPL
ncbi:DUF6458 family protein [Aeromicrobium sp.]|uniref:DUF6458 family protein n=1 Tax=Aeromicrobium sp. TaxID=1871063 RepID=UPI003C317FAD